MKLQSKSLHLFALCAMLLATATSCKTRPYHAAVPGVIPGRPTPWIKILSKPYDQLVGLSNSVTFAVVADVLPPWASQPLDFQWEVNKIQYVLANTNLNWVDVPGAHTNVLTINHVMLNDVGFYRCRIKSGGLSNITEPAVLQVWRSGSIIVTGTPTVTSGSASCPGSYAGYVNYINGGSGWAPTPGITSHVSRDANAFPGNTKVQAGGNLGDKACGSGSATITGSPPTSTRYRFTIYFPGPVPTGNYDITLDGYDIP